MRIRAAGTPAGLRGRAKLLTGDGGRYANTDLSARFLTEDSPESLLCWLRVMARWKQPWAQLAEAVRRGEAVDNQSKWLGEDPSSCVTSSWACISSRPVRGLRLPRH
ncbi:hypothetical protein WJ972_02480 [Achromobacter insuavis]